MEKYSPIDSDDLRKAMRMWTSGVTVVTASFENERHGMTVSSFTSISLSPPRILVSLEMGTRTLQLARDSGYIGVTILQSAQREISERFAGRIPEIKDRFEGLEVYTLVSGAPLLSDGLAGFDCRVVSTMEVGDRTLFIADVMSTKIGARGMPLIYHDRDYRRICD